MALKLKLEGNKALLKSLDKYSDKVKQRIGDEIEATTYDIQAKAIQRVNPDFGFLKNSINVQNDRSQLKGQVEVTTKYAPYVEFGTGGFVDIPAGLEDYAMTFYVNGKGTMHPSPFLFPAFFEESKKMMENIKKELVKWK